MISRTTSQIARTTARRLSSIAAAPSSVVKVSQIVPKTAPPSAFRKVSQVASKVTDGHLAALVGGVGVATVLALQSNYGIEHDKYFYDFTFETTADPDDLADLYGSESFMDIYSVLPFMGELMMRGGTFDEEGHVHTYGLPGTMEIDMEFTDEDEPDGTTGRFEKREHFRNTAVGGRVVLWDMVANFGFEHREDGTCLVHHRGEYFYGPFPIHLLFRTHARYVAWATEQHINAGGAFGREGLEEEAEAQRRNMPLHMAKRALGIEHTVC